MLYVVLVCSKNVLSEHCDAVIWCICVKYEVVMKSSEGIETEQISFCLHAPEEQSAKSKIVHHINEVGVARYVSVNHVVATRRDHSD